MSQIEISGMEFYSYHGHYSVEQLVGNRFIVDLTLDLDCSKAVESDQLADTINYQEAYQLVKKEMETNSHLLEHIAGRILSSLHLAFSTLHKARVRISKLNPPLGGQIDKVCVTLEKEWKSLSNQD